MATRSRAMKRVKKLLPSVLLALACAASAKAQSICDRQPNPAACRGNFGIPDDVEPDAVVIGSISGDGWTFAYRLPKSGSRAKPVTCPHGGDLTLAQGSYIEVWLIADRGIHPWRVPTLGVDQTAFAGSYAPVRIDTSRIGVFPGIADDKQRRTPAIRILDPVAYAGWARRALGHLCTP